MDRDQIKDLILKNYTLEDVLDMYVSRLSLKEIEALQDEDRALEADRAEVEGENETKN